MSNQNFLARYGDADHLRKIVDDPSTTRETIRHAFKNEMMPPDLIKKSVHSSKPAIRASAFGSSHPIIDEHDIDHELQNHDDVESNDCAIKHPSISDKTLKRVLTSEYHSDRNAAMSNPKFNSTHVEHMLKHGSPEMKVEALHAGSQHVRDHHLQLGIIDPNPLVQKTAKAIIQRRISDDQLLKDLFQ